MMFESLSAFMDMGGHGAFVWSAYGIALIVFGYNVVAPIRHRTSMPVSYTHLTLPTICSV